MHDAVSQADPGSSGHKMINVPEVIPIFPLPRTVLLPGEILPLHIFEERYRAMVRDAIASHKMIGMVEVLPGFEGELPEIPPIETTGCLGLIGQHKELDDGRFLLWLIGLERFNIDEELLVGTGYRQARVTYTEIDAATGVVTIPPLRQELKSLIPGLIETDEVTVQALVDQLQDVDDSQLIALASQVLELNSTRKRQILEAATLAERFMLVFEDLYAHLEKHPGLGEIDPSELN